MNTTEHATRRKIDGWTTREGQVIAWADIDDRHLLNIVRMLARQLRPAAKALAWNTRLIRYYPATPSSLAEARKHLALARKILDEKRQHFSAALDEVEYRGLLPTLDDLRVAWDRACEAGAADDPKQRPWCLIELWVGFRGESTLSPEWQLANAGLTGATASTTPAPHA